MILYCQAPEAALGTTWTQPVKRDILGRAAFPLQH